MTTQSQKDGGVNRLLDMVVEEVSLVDRAANNRKFLIVKRDESMDEDTNIDKAEGELPTVDDSTDGLGDGSPLGAAIAALESLTSIVEVLGSLGANRADTRLAELARELRDTAEQILTQVEDGTDMPPTDGAYTTEASTDGSGAADDTTMVVEGRAKAKGKPPAGKPPAKRPSKTDAAATEDDGTDEVVAAKAALTKLVKLLEGLKGAVAPVAASTSTPAASETPDLATTVTKLAESVQALTQSFQDHQQRLGRVEKQFGMPNSSPAAEQVSKGADEAVGWPLDLNHPMDRHNVDKAVSFHDP